MAVATKRRLKFWGWVYEYQQASPDEVREAAAGIRAHLGFEPAEIELPVALEAVELPEPRVRPPGQLAEVCSSEPYERVTHALGKGYRDLVRAFRRRIDHPPDVVARPRDEGEVEAVLAWCADAGAGPSPDRLLLGSEGTLGVITEAWVRLQARPRWRASAGVRFASFEAGAAAVRELSQSGLEPSNCRLLDPGEAAITGAASGGNALLVLGFESGDHPLEPWMERALECCGDHGGEAADGARFSGPGSEAGRDEGAGAWRAAFLAAPYLRDTMIMAGVFSETFETAITWDRLEQFVGEVRAQAEAALRDVSGAGTVTCRFTHVYPDGPAPYFTMLAPAVRGGELEQWDAVKAAASDAVIAAGGTITHHHAVGRDHRPWYDRQRPDPFARALRAAKAELDPQGILNPGVLIDPA